MQGTWLSASWITKALWVGTALVFIVAEAVALEIPIEYWARNPALAIQYIIYCSIIIAVPGVAGFQGYRILSNWPPNSEDSRLELYLTYLSRQFALITVFSYAAIIASIMYIDRISTSKG